MIPISDWGLFVIVWKIVLYTYVEYRMSRYGNVKIIVLTIFIYANLSILINIPSAREVPCYRVYVHTYIVCTNCEYRYKGGVSWL